MLVLMLYKLHTTKKPKDMRNTLTQAHPALDTVRLASSLEMCVCKTFVRHTYAISRTQSYMYYRYLSPTKTLDYSAYVCCQLLLFSPLLSVLLALST